MSKERFDFSALDPARDPRHFERMVGDITGQARMELARRATRNRVSPVEMVAAWFRPALVAAAAVAAVSLMLLATVRHSTAHADLAAGAYLTGTEVPVALTSWYEDDATPTAAELLVASEGGK